MSVFQLYILALVIPFMLGLMVYFIRSIKAILPLVVVFLLIALASVAYALITIKGPAMIRFEWFPDFDLGWKIDLISLSMTALVLLVSLLVHVFSFYYLEGDAGIKRYYLQLGFFTSSMIGLLGADHLVLLFVFWELVGFFSFLLIGFWFADADKASSARNAFITNRVADLGLLTGILCIWIAEGTFFISEVAGSNSDLYVFGSFGILIGAMGKSAQFPFHTWLPKAMAGPTPVSALIHAATMVAAGVYLLVRLGSVLPEVVLTAAAIIGSFTALLAAFFAMTQFDIKSVLAYSTISQLGYMVMAVGVGAYEGGFFHLWTHAFFKAGLFLSAGLIIHNLAHSDGDPQDMRNMGGLRKAMPTTFLAFTICMSALIGLPFFTGFLSKDAILSSALSWASGQLEVFWIIPLMAFFTAFLTAYYMIRQWKLIFWGAPDRGKMKEPLVAVLPVTLLSLGSIWIWYSWNPFGHEFHIVRFLFSEVVADHQFAQVSVIASLILVLMAIGISWRKGHGEMKQSMAVNLSYHGLYLDDLYQRSVVHLYNRISFVANYCDTRLIDPALNKLAMTTVVFSHLIHAFDKYVIDGMVNFVAGLTRFIGDITRRQQAHNWQRQFLWLLLILIACFWLILKEI